MHLGRRLSAGQWQIETELQEQAIPLFCESFPFSFRRLGVCEARLGCLYRSPTPEGGWENEVHREGNESSVEKRS
jgi:hypothetical protein